jgi:hypothetical protein
MNRRTTRHPLRRIGATLCAAALAAGVLGVTAAAPAGAEPRTQIATPPPPGGGVQITVQQVIVLPQPIGPLSFT